jgi:hypothetical protein
MVFQAVSLHLLRAFSQTFSQLLFEFAEFDFGAMKLMTPEGVLFSF